MPHSTVRALISSLLLAGLSACGIVSSFHPHVPSTDDPSRRAGASTGGPSVGKPSIGDRAGTASRTREVDEQQVCRSSGAPRGWIAVAYFSASEQCPARAGGDSASTSATAAIITHYAVRPVGTELDVCVDQNTPIGWESVTDEAAEDTGRCPGAARGDKPTTRRIRRLR